MCPAHCDWTSPDCWVYLCTHTQSPYIYIQCTNVGEILILWNSAALYKANCIIFPQGKCILVVIVDEILQYERPQCNSSRCTQCSWCYIIPLGKYAALLHSSVFGVGFRCRYLATSAPGDRLWQTLTFFRNPNVEPSSYPYTSTEWFSDIPMVTASSLLLMAQEERTPRSTKMGSVIHTYIPTYVFVYIYIYLYTLWFKKNAPTLADYNYDPVQSILIIFSKLFINDHKSCLVVNFSPHHTSVATIPCETQCSILH